MSHSSEESQPSSIKLPLVAEDCIAARKWMEQELILGDPLIAVRGSGPRALSHILSKHKPEAEKLVCMLEHIAFARDAIRQNNIGQADEYLQQAEREFEGCP